MSDRANAFAIMRPRAWRRPTIIREHNMGFWRPPSPRVETLARRLRVVRAAWASLDAESCQVSVR